MGNIPLLLVACTMPGLALVLLIRLRKLSLAEFILHCVGLSLIFNLVFATILNFMVVNPFSAKMIIFYLVCLVLLASGAGLRHLYSKKDYPLIEPKPKLNRWAIAPFAIYIVSLGLLFQTTLLSPNLVGSDIHLEYYHASQTISNGYWDWQGVGSVNSCLSITIFLPFLSVISGIKLLWILKVVQPMLFALVPVIIYQIYRAQFSKLVSLLAVAFFVTLPLFFLDLTQLARQQTGELFMVLAVMVLINRGMSWQHKLLIATLFSAAVVLSHYGLGTGFIMYLVIATICIPIICCRIGRRWIAPAINGNKSAWAVPLVVTVICITLAVPFYTTVAKGVGKVGIKVVTNITNAAAQGIVSDTKAASSKAPNSSKPGIVAEKPPSSLERNSDISQKEPLLQTALGLDIATASVWGKIWRIIQVIVGCMVLIGCLRLLIKPKPIYAGLRAEWLALTIAVLVALGGIFVLPTWSYGLGITRLAHISLIFLAPMFVIGADTIGSIFKRMDRQKATLSIALVVMIPYAVFNSGAVFELTKSTKSDYIDLPYSIALSGHRLDLSTLFTEQDAEAVEWLVANRIDNIPIYADGHGMKLIIQHYGYDYAGAEQFDLSKIDGTKAGYIYLREWNVDNAEITTGVGYGTRRSVPFKEIAKLNKVISDSKVLYQNGAQILFYKGKG